MNTRRLIREYKLRIWTEREPRPFGFGDRAELIATTVTVKGPYPLANGFNYVTVRDPKGVVRIVEPITGGLIGLASELEQIGKDVAQASTEVLRKQVETEKLRGKSAREMPAKEFWGFFYRSGI